MSPYFYKWNALATNASFRPDLYSQLFETFRTIDRINFQTYY